MTLRLLHKYPTSLTPWLRLLCIVLCHFSVCPRDWALGTYHELSFLPSIVSLLSHLWRFPSQRRPCVQLLVWGLGDSATREKDKGCEDEMGEEREGGTDRQTEREERGGRKKQRKTCIIWIIYVQFAPWRILTRLRWSVFIAIRMQFSLLMKE